MSSILIDIKERQLEEYRLDLLNDLVFYARLEHWDRVEKLKDVYRSIYGKLPGDNNE